MYTVIVEIDINHAFNNIVMIIIINWKFYDHCNSVIPHIVQSNDTVRVNKLKK